MAHYQGSNKARLEQIRRRKQFYQNAQKPTRDRERVYRGDVRFFLGMEYNEWRVRRLAPFALLIHALSVSCLLGLIIFSGKTKVDKTSFAIEKGEVGSFEVSNAGSIYSFEVSQAFPSNQAPLYSELEIEIVDENMNHMYSFYKDLWQEKHPNGEGGTGIYRDLKMTFEVELPKAGIYYLRGIPYNNNEGVISARVYEKFTGNIYFQYYAIVFGVISILLLVGSGAWGNPGEMIEALKRGRSIKHNKPFKYAVVIAGLIVVGTIVINLTHYGYAKAGDETRLPTYFYKKQNVDYLG